MVREGSWSLDDAPPPGAYAGKPAAPPQPAARAGPPEGAADTDVEYTYGFTWSQGALEVSIAAGLLLIAGILSAVAGSVAWGGLAAQGAEVEIFLKEVHGSFQGFPLKLDWSSQIFDDENGIGQVRMAGTLGLVGTITTYVALGLVATSIFLRTATMTALGSIIGAIAILLTLASLLMFPSGAEKVWDSLSGDGGEVDGSELPKDIAWGGGLVVAWIAAVCGLLGVIGGFVAIRHGDVS